MDGGLIAILIAFGLLCIYTAFDYLRICKSCKLEELRLRGSTYDAPRPRREDWFRWPERKVGPIGRTHLGRRV